MAIVFEQVDGTLFFDLKIDGRAAEYDVEEHEFEQALRRRRVDPRADVFVEDETGYRERLRRGR